VGNAAFIRIGGDRTWLVAYQKAKNGNRVMRGKKGEGRKGEKPIGTKTDKRLLDEVF